MNCTGPTYFASRAMSRYTVSCHRMGVATQGAVPNRQSYCSSIVNRQLLYLDLCKCRSLTVVARQCSHCTDGSKLYEGYRLAHATVLDPNEGLGKIE